MENPGREDLSLRIEISWENALGWIAVIVIFSLILFLGGAYAGFRVGLEKGWQQAVGEELEESLRQKKELEESLRSREQKPAPARELRQSKEYLL